MSHGVWPPLTAMMKRPRADTADRASAEMIAAAFRATALLSSSSSISIRASPVPCPNRYSCTPSSRVQRITDGGRVGDACVGELDA